MATNTETQAAPAEPTGDPADEKKETPVNPWTQTFVQIAQYLVKDYRDRVKVAPQFELFQMPMRIDAVVIIQEDGLVIDNALMRSFKRHNILEFKSPNDTLTIGAFDKTISYFYAYLSNESENEKPPIRFNDVTLTIVSVRKPLKVLKTLREERNYKIIDTETPGIYYIIKDGFIPEKIQLVVSSELPDDERDKSFVWLRSLRNDLTPDEAQAAVKRTEDPDDHKTLWNIVRFILSVNTEILPEVKKRMVANAELQKFFDDVAIESGMVRTAARKAAEDKAREMARTMLLDGEPIEKIVKYTKLDRGDVVTLAALTQ